MQTKKASHHAEISVKYASKPATGMQGYAMTTNKHLTPLKGVELRSLLHTGFIEPKDNRTCFVLKMYLTEPVELCQWDVTLTLVKLNTAQICKIKTTCYAREVSIKLANCNRNFATRPFSHQKNTSTLWCI